MNNNELEQAHNLLLETAEVMTQFRQSTHQIVQNLEDKLDKSLYDQRKMITEMVRAEVTKEMSNSVAGYVRDYFACNGNIGYWRIGIIFLLYNVD